jgi:hypothetical protein
MAFSTSHSICCECAKRIGGAGSASMGNCTLIAARQWMPQYICALLRAQLRDEGCITIMQPGASE